MNEFVYFSRKDNAWYNAAKAETKFYTIHEKHPDLFFLSEALNYFFLCIALFLP